MKKVLFLFVIMLALVGCSSEKPVESIPEETEESTLIENTSPTNETVDFEKNEYYLEGMDTIKPLGPIPYTPDSIRIEGNTVAFLYHYCMEDLTDEDYAADVKRDEEGNMYLYYAELKTLDEPNVYVSVKGETIPSWKPMLSVFGDNPQFYFKIEDDKVLVSSVNAFDEYDTYILEKPEE